MYPSRKKFNNLFPTVKHQSQQTWRVHRQKLITRKSEAGVVQCFREVVETTVRLFYCRTANTTQITGWMEKTTVFPSGAIFWNHSLAAHEIIVSQPWTYIGDCSYKFPANHHRLSINHNHRVCGPALMITCLRAFLALIMEIDGAPIIPLE